MYRFARKRIAPNVYHSTISYCAAALVALALTPFGSLADSGVRDLTWADLAPGGRDRREYVRQTSPVVSLVLELKGDAPKPPRMADGLDGERVRLSGYVVPLKFSGGGVEEFLLVPYAGACIHVPPPPKNQIVLVTSAKPIDARGLYQAVTVTGTISVGGSQTGLAEAGYRMTAGKVADYSEYRVIKRIPGHPDATARP